MKIQLLLLLPMLGLKFPFSWKYPCRLQVVLLPIPPYCTAPVRAARRLRNCWWRCCGGLWAPWWPSGAPLDGAFGWRRTSRQPRQPRWWTFQCLRQVMLHQHLDHPNQRKDELQHQLAYQRQQCRGTSSRLRRRCAAAGSCCGGSCSCPPRSWSPAAPPTPPWGLRAGSRRQRRWKAQEFLIETCLSLQYCD